jgi:hypothetical protein
MCVRLAEEIIKQFSLIGCICLIHHLENNTDYSNKLINNLEKKLWEDVVVDLAYEYTIYYKNLNVPIIKNLHNMILFKHKYLNSYKWYKDLLLKNNIKAIYLPNYIALSQDEGLIYLAGRKLALEINKYEEGISQQAIFYQSNLKTWVKTKIKFLTLNIFKNLDNFNFLISIRGKFNKYFTVFPELYPYKNYNYVEKLKFEHVFKKKLELQFSNHTLYLSDPLSEDGLISYEKEVELIKFIARDKQVIIKFHPRESIEKINYLMNELNLKTLPNNLSAIAAEDLIANYKFKALSGTICNTLFYAEKFSGMQVYSYIEWLDNKKYVKHYKKFMNTHFRKIQLL